MTAASMRQPPSAFAEVQQQPDGIELNLESLLPSDLTFAIEFAQPAKPSKPPAYKPTALPTQFLQPSTSAVIPLNNPWSYDPGDSDGRSNLGSQQSRNYQQQHSPSLLATSRSVPDRSANLHHIGHQAYNHHYYNHHNQHQRVVSTPSNSNNGTAVSPRPQMPLQLVPPPPPPPRGGATPSIMATAPPPPVSPSGAIRVSSSSSSSASPRQSPVHGRSGNSDYGSAASPEHYYAIGQPPPPPPRDGAAAATSVASPAARTSDGTSGQRAPGTARSFVRRNSAGSGANYGAAPPPPPSPPPPPPPRDSSAGPVACPPLDLGALTTAACDGSVHVTQSSRGGGGGGGGGAQIGADSWPPPPPPPPSKTSAPRPPALLQPPPPPPPRSDAERLRSRSSNSSAAPFNSPYGSGYLPVMPPPPPPPPRNPGLSSDGPHSADSAAAISDAADSPSFKIPTVHEAQMLVAAALQDDTDSSLAAALELSSKLQSLAAQRIAASMPPGHTTARSPVLLSGANGHGSFTAQSGAPPPPPPPPPLPAQYQQHQQLLPSDSGRLSSMGSGALFTRTSNTPRGNGGYPAALPPPPPPPRHMSSGNGLGMLQAPQQQQPPPPPPRAPVPQPPSAEVAAVMAALPEVRSPFALFQRTSDDDDCCPSPPDENAILQQQLQQLSHFGTSPSCGFAAAKNSASAAAAAAAAAAMAAASSAPFGNPYAGLFSGNSMAASAPYVRSAMPSVFAGSDMPSGAFGSDVFSTSATTPSSVAAAAAAAMATSVGNQEMSLVSLTSLLATLAALAKQGGGSSAADCSASVSPDAVSTGATSSVSCGDPSGPGTPAATAVLPAEPSSGLSPNAVASASPTAMSIAESDDACTATVRVHVSPATPLVSPPASTIAIDEPMPEASDLAMPTAAFADALPSAQDFALSSASLVGRNVVGTAPSLSALQQALALLTVDMPLAAAPPPPTMLISSAASAGSGLRGVMRASAAASEDVCSSVVSLPGVTHEELQMARSLHAALKVVALLDSLSGGVGAGCQAPGYHL